MQDDDFFWDGIAAGELRFQQCENCGKPRHPPVPMCGACNSLRWTSRAASGRGTLHAWIVSRPPGEPAAAPRLVALVELAEGVRMVSNLIDCPPEAAVIDMPLELCFGEQDGRRLPQFRPLPVR